MASVTDKWTVVQHSGFGYKDNPQFEHAVEVRQIHNEGELRRVERVGGILLNSYMEAEAFAERANYTPSNKSIIPNARGTFSKLQIDALCIYIPVRGEPVGLWRSSLASFRSARSMGK
jgi:hypothetical protein